MLFGPLWLQQKEKRNHKRAQKQPKKNKPKLVTDVPIQDEIDPRQKEAAELLSAVRHFAIMSQARFDETWPGIQTTAQVISRAAGIELDLTRSDLQKITAGFIFEKTKLPGVLRRIQSGERVKQDEFTTALRNFVEQQIEGETIGCIKPKGGSIVKLTSAVSATTVHLHHKGKDDTVHVSDWLYTRVIDWLQRSGIAIESSRAA